MARPGLCWASRMQEPCHRLLPTIPLLQRLTASQERKKRGPQGKRGLEQNRLLYCDLTDLGFQVPQLAFLKVVVKSRKPTPPLK